MTKSIFDPRIFGCDTILNYQLSQKLKLIRRSKFNYLIITLTFASVGLLDTRDCISMERLSISSNHKRGLIFALVIALN
jgi:hypothetical protein